MPSPITFKKFPITKKIIHYGLSTLITLLGLCVMIGWITHNQFLIQISPQFAPMQFNTALCFLLSGIALLCIEKWEKISSALGIVIFLFGFLTLCQYVLRINIGLDQFFIKSTINTYVSHPGRMAPNTALCFLFTASMLVLNGFFGTFKWPRLMTLMLSIMIGLLGLLAFLSYFF